MDIITLAAAKKYTDKTLDGMGSLQGKDGKSAYQIWLDNGNKGTEQDFLNSLKGASGVYVGSGEMPDNCNVQIDPDGTIIDLGYVTPETYGAVGDGQSDDTEAITESLNSGKKVVFDRLKTYLISSTIVIPENAFVDFGGATIKPNSNIDVIQVKPGSYVENLIVRCTDVVGWDSSAMVFYGGDKFSASNPTRLNNIKLYNDIQFRNGYSVGNGVYLYLDANGRYIEGINASNVVTCGFGYGIRMSDLTDVDEPTAERGFIGANNFPSYWSYRDAIGICMDAKSTHTITTNNFFTDLNIQSDYYNSSKYAIYCRGDSNYFSGCLYDYVILEYHPSVAIYFDLGSTKNYVEVTAGHVNAAGYCVDLGGYNKVVRHHYANDIIAPINGRFGAVGNQDDIFAFLDKRAECTLKSLDTSPYAGDISSVFDPSPNKVLTYYKNPTDGKCRAEITINLNKVLQRMTHFILQFPPRHSPTKVKVTVYNADTAKVIYDTTNNAESNIIISPGFNDIDYIENISKIIVELDGTYSFSGIEQPSWSISRIMAVDGYNTGNAWLRRDGGEVYGNIKFTDNNGAILASEGGKKYLITVSDEGVLGTTEWIEDEEEAPESAILIPVMAAGASWYNTEAAGAEQNTITRVIFNADYEPTGNEDSSWACDDSGFGRIMAYRNGTEVVIKSTTGSEVVKLNPDSSYMFTNDGTNANFAALESVEGTENWIADNNTNMKGAFSKCSVLTTPPVLPDGIISINNTFAACYVMQYLPEIPSTVVDMEYAFHGCKVATSAPSVIPAGVKKMQAAFRNCWCLNDTIEVNATNLTSYYACFENTSRDEGSIILTGSCPILAELAATNTQGKVTVG